MGDSTLTSMEHSSLLSVTAVVPRATQRPVLLTVRRLVVGEESVWIFKLKCFLFIESNGQY